MELQDIEQHSGIYTTVCDGVCRLLKCMVTAAKVGLGNHICSSKVGLKNTPRSSELLNYLCFRNVATVKHQ